MKTITILTTLSLVLLITAPARSTVTFDWATVGNADDVHGDRFGGVGYTYRISKHEVTNAQYTEFLNAVDPTGANPLSLYNPDMSSEAHGGININGGGLDGSKYEIKSGRGDNPVVYVSFIDAIRFTNWLENGQGNGNTETGVYTIGSGFDEVRNPNATFFIPSQDEWYKAAYHKNDGITGNYWDYPTSTDTEPYSDNPGSLNTPDNTNVANFYKIDGIANGYDDKYAVTGANFVRGQNYLTDVGAYSLAISPYGTFDQGGNILEWNEAVITFSSSNRGVRGGSWGLLSYQLSAMDRRFSDPTNEFSFLGFRVASIPEPSALLLEAMAIMGLLLRRRALN